MLKLFEHRMCNTTVHVQYSFFYVVGYLTVLQNYLQLFLFVFLYSLQFNGKKNLQLAVGVKTREPEKGRSYGAARTGNQLMHFNILGGKPVQAILASHTSVQHCCVTLRHSLMVVYH